MSSTSIVIVARNAARTIRRALASALAEGNYPIILVDDCSQDDTVAVAENEARGRIQVHRLCRHTSLGYARQTALQSIETPYGVWLDADDELLPRRVATMTRELEAGGADIVSDGLEIVDGETGLHLGTAAIPEFLRAAKIPARLFERNYLPGIGVVGFRTDFARRIRFDPHLHGAEDVDFVLRSMSRGGRFTLLEDIGYRSYAYPGSISRHADNQRSMYRIALLKHSYDDVRKLCSLAGHDERITAWCLVSMAIFRRDFPAASAFIEEAASWVGDPDEILEPDGPFPLSEGWRLCFHRGTLLLQLGRTAHSVPILEKAMDICPSAEVANNLGVARSRLGERAQARRLFETALFLFPEFADARVNLESREAERVTTHPLRTHVCRRDYSDTRCLVGSP